MTLPAAGTYQIDPAHTFVDFTAQHLVVGHVRGRFTQLAGQITVAEDLTQSATSVTITATGSRWGLEGDLTITDITRPVELLTEFTGSAIDNLGNAKVAFLAQARISRHDFGTGPPAMS